MLQVNVLITALKRIMSLLCYTWYLFDLSNPTDGGGLPGNISNRRLFSKLQQYLLMLALFADACDFH